jgi:uncharacterized protein YbjT (DUF2867 family)
MRIGVAGGTGTVGRHVVARGAQAGHDMVVLSRSRGVDVRRGNGLANALDGVAVAVNVMNAPPTEDATAFFTDTARMLARVGAERGVSHIVTLSIVGIERTTFAYYAAKIAQEQAAAAGPVPSTVLRATQFHEFPAQIIARTRNGAEARVPDLRVKTVAARTVANVLLELAERAPRDRAPDLAGPQEADLIDLARTFVAHRGIAIMVHADADIAAGIPERALIPGDGARIEGPTFEEWLATPEAAGLSL